MKIPRSDSDGVPAAWRATVDQHKHADTWKSCWQVATSLPPFFAMWGVMYWSLSYSYWLTLLLAAPTAAFLVRIFVIQHDCGHHSFFHSTRANDTLGIFCGFLTFTPYYFWRRTHARHHVTSGNLSHRGYGDVQTLTVEEYLSRSRWGRLRYRLYRSPLAMFFVIASYQFVFQQRFTQGAPKSWKRERRSVYVTNLAILAVAFAAWFKIGVMTLVLIQLPVLVLAAAVGSWMFFIQHQFEDAYWEPDATWDFNRSALEGSSYYRLPRVLQWFTANIGFHHIHHLNSRIPNYHLASCYDSDPALREAVTFGLRDSLKCASLKLWDADRQRMVTFADVHARAKSALVPEAPKAAPQETPKVAIAEPPRAAA